MTTDAATTDAAGGAERAPVLYLSHGAPTLLEDPAWPDELARWAGQLETPSAILMVSAHWEQAPISVSSTLPGTGLFYDFWGFAPEYYQLQYPAPVAPELAGRVERLISGDTPVVRDQARGLDHGAFIPLMTMFPNADVPVLQLSMPTLEPSELFRMGQALTPLRDEGVLIVGSGFTTHNLNWISGGNAAAAPNTPGAEFDAWAAQMVAAGDVDAILQTDTVAPAAALAHPRTEHWAPIYLSLGAAYGPDGSASDVVGDSVIDGFWYKQSKRSWQFG